MPRTIERLRNIGIMAHVDAGKTTCAERILFLAGRIHKKGEVHHGNTRLDFHPLEQDKGITIQAAATSVRWSDHVIQLVDTPGHVDFTIEVERSLRVLDGAIFVLDAASGVECQSETVFRQAEHHGVPCVAFVNKCDKPGADFAACIREIEEKLGVLALPVQLPHRGDRGVAVVDVLARALVVEGGGGRTRRLAPVPEELRSEVELARKRLTEACAEHDEDVMFAFCNESDAESSHLVRALRKMTLARKGVVVLCGAALADVGIGPLLDAVVRYLPSPADRPPVRGADGERETTRDPNDDEPLCALAFKTTTDAMGGLVTWLRVYSGVLEAGAPVLVTPRGVRERVRRIYVPDADDREVVARAGAGSVVCVTGLAGVRTGETIADPEAPIALEAIRVPETVVSVVVEARTSADRDKLGPALAKLIACDPSLRATVDPESGQTVLSGMGTLHLEIAAELLATEHGVAVTTGKPHVAYRTTVRGRGLATYRHKKQNGGVGQFAVVTLTVAPGERGTGVVFVDETKGGVVPSHLALAVERGVRSAAERGVGVHEHPLVDVVVALTDGETHVKDSKPPAFEIAASFAFREAASVAGISVLEPVALVQVIAPEAHTGDVLGELASRRGLVRDVVPRGRDRVTITARVPVASTFDFVPRLRAITHGRGEALVRPDGYEPAPST